MPTTDQPTDRNGIRKMCADSRGHIVINDERRYLCLEYQCWQTNSRSNAIKAFVKYLNYKKKMQNKFRRKLLIIRARMVETYGVHTVRLATTKRHSSADIYRKLKMLNEIRFSILYLLFCASKLTRR